MTAGAIKAEETGGLAARVCDRLRGVDPAGAYALYAIFVAAVAGLAAVAGFALAMLVTDAAHARFGAICAGIVTGIGLMTAQPGAARRPVRQIVVIGGAVLACAGLGAAVAHVPAVAQPLTVALAFAGFYVRRWPEPLPSAGFLGVIAFLVQQILSQYAPPAAMACAVVAAVLGVAAGYWLMPRAVFTDGVVAAVRRLRAAMPQALAGPLDTLGDVRATVARIDDLLAAVNAARAQADRFNASRADRHLAVVQAAAAVARVWENTAESLRAAGGDGDAAFLGAREAARAAKAAVVDALAHPSTQAHDAALAALDVLDRAVAEAIAGPYESHVDGNTPFDLLNAELTLSHLMDAVARLDAALAGPGAAR